MQAAYTTRRMESNQWFAEADEQYAALKRKLLEKEYSHASHTQLEELLDTHGRELLRLLLQGQLESRKAAEPTEPVVGDDGVERIHRRKGTSRNLVSIFGPVRVERLGMSAREAGSRFLLDAELNLPVENYSLGVRKRAAIAAAQSSFEQARSTLASTIGVEVPKRQLEELVARGATDFEAYYEGTAVSQSPEETSGLLIQTFDSTGITMHMADLREATRAKAEQARATPGAHEGSGDRAHRKRMTAVAAVYTLEPWTRTPEDILRAMAPVRDVSANKDRPKPENKRVWASVNQDMETVIRQSFQEAQDRDPKHTKDWVVLVDGDPHQIRVVKKMAKRFRVRVTS